MVHSLDKIVSFFLLVCFLANPGFQIPMSIVPGLANVDLVGIIAIVGGVGLLFFIIGFFIERFTKLGDAHPETLRAIRDWLLILWAGFSAYGVLTLTGFTSVLSLLTLSGIAGLVVSLALQNTLGNMIAGFLLLRDRAIRKGDIIQYSGIRGKIVRIALRNTWVVNEAGEVIVIGNTALSGGPLVNISAAKRFPEFSRSAPHVKDLPVVNGEKNSENVKQTQDLAK